MARSQCASPPLASWGCNFWSGWQSRLDRLEFDCPKSFRCAFVCALFFPTLQFEAFLSIANGVSLLVISIVGVLRPVFLRRFRMAGASLGGWLVVAGTSSLGAMLGLLPSIAHIDASYFLLEVESMKSASTPIPPSGRYPMALGAYSLFPQGLNFIELYALVAIVWIAISCRIALKLASGNGQISQRILVSAAFLLITPIVLGVSGYYTGLTLLALLVAALLNALRQSSGPDGDIWIHPQLAWISTLIAVSRLEAAVYVLLVFLLFLKRFGSVRFSVLALSFSGAALGAYGQAKLIGTRFPAINDLVYFDLTVLLVLMAGPSMAWATLRLTRFRVGPRTWLSLAVIGLFGAAFAGAVYHLLSPYGSVEYKNPFGQLSTILYPVQNLFLELGGWGIGGMVVFLLVLNNFASIGKKLSFGAETIGLLFCFLGAMKVLSSGNFGGTGFNDSINRLMLLALPGIFILLFEEFVPATYRYSAKPNLLDRVRGIRRHGGKSSKKVGTRQC